MDARVETTPTAPGGEKRPSWLTVLRGGLDLLLVPILAVFSALVIGGIIIVVTDTAVYSAWGDNGLSAGLAAAWRSVAVAYRALYSGSLGDAGAISESLVASTPYIFAGLAVALGFRGGLFNIGGEGQLLVAAGVSVVIGYSFELPAIIHLPLALGGGALGGAIYGAIPGYLKAKTGAHEVINTIMMNFIAFRFFDWAFTGPLRRPGGDAPVTQEIFPTAYLPKLFAAHRFHWGFFVALAVAFIVWWLLFKTTLGFEIRTVGANPNAARYGGIKITRITVLTMAISGALAGLAGANEVLGLNHFLASGFSAGYGFDAIALALLGKSHPLGVVLAALLFGTLRNGATRMQSLASIPIDIISIIQALVIIFIAAPAIVRWIYRVRAQSDLESTTFTRGWGA
jgi:simple sugar transport system permease protein